MLLNKFNNERKIYILPEIEKEKDTSEKMVCYLSKNKLRHFKEHIFKLYEGQRLQDLIHSVREHGIISPIIVREVAEDEDGTTYEILSGHNRFEAGKIVGLKDIPCIIKYNLSDEEASLIVSESNLIQRSFSDMKHSERALVISIHYNLLRKRGKRSDLIKDVETLIINTVKPKKQAQNTTFNLNETKLRTEDKVGLEYGLSRMSIARYLRLNLLIDSFKNMVDDDKLPIRAGVELSYLSSEQQEEVFNLVQRGQYQINIEKAEEIRSLLKKKKFSINTIENIFNSQKTSSDNNESYYKIKRSKFSDYFRENASNAFIEKTVKKALAFYYENLEKAEKEVENNK